MDKNFFDRNWWKDLGVAIIATTVSIVLTFGTAALVDAHKRKEARRMTAMMVLSNIESFIRSMEDHCEELARKDTVSTWLLRLSTEQIQKMDQDTLMDYLRETNRRQDIRKHLYQQYRDLGESGKLRFHRPCGRIFYGHQLDYFPMGHDNSGNNQ